MLRSVARSASKAGLFGRRGMLLAKADRKRDERNWLSAAALYREYLALKPADWAIWVQFGHALKEMGQLAEAESAYQRAVDIEPGSSDAHLQLGHVRKLSGRLGAATSAYARAVALDPGCQDARAELLGLASEPAKDDVTIDSNRERLAPPSLAGTERDVAQAGTVLDVSDLIAYFQAARRPTGIQRVQIEVASNLLRSAHDGSGTVGICAFVEASNWWVEIPDSLLLEASELARGGGRDDTAWQNVIGKIQVILEEARPMAFRPGAALVNLGTSWWMANYLLAVRNAKTARDIRYIPFVHDLIPIMRPEYCVAGLPEQFIAWASDVFEHADHFLVNSHSTRRDLLAVAERLGRRVGGEMVTVVPLDADFRSPPASSLPTQALAKWGIEAQRYVLFVATIEARKNHLGAFRAWLALLERHGAEVMPQLVCVGKQGWLYEDAMAVLGASDILKSRVVLLPSLSDEELTLLYQNCLFTLYPSHYEGWGLPVTESLCYGKVPLLSTAASLPEAGGSFADYFEEGSAAALAEAIERLAFDDAYRTAREKLICESFRPRSWREIATQVLEAAAQARNRPGRPQASFPPMAQIGAYYPLKRRHDARILSGARTNDVFRSGENWRTCDERAAWTGSGGSRITLRLAGPHGALVGYFGIEGATGAACRCRLQFHIADRTVLMERPLAPGEKLWLACDFPPAEADETISLTLYAEPSQDAEGGEDRTQPSIGLIGFCICGIEDLAARTEFLEAASAGDLSRMETIVKMHNG